MHLPLKAVRAIVIATTLGSALGGCAVVDVAGAAAGAAISVGSAVVSTGVTVTGKVVGAGVDAAVGSGESK